MVRDVIAKLNGTYMSAWSDINASVDHSKEGKCDQRDERAMRVGDESGRREQGRDINRNLR